MKLASLLCFVGTVLSLSVGQFLVKSEANAQHVEGSYLVKLKTNVRSGLETHLEQVKSLFFGRSGENSISYVYKGLGSNSYAAKFTPQVLEKVKNLAEVEYIEKDKLISVQTLQTDAPWGLNRLSQRAKVKKLNYESRAIYNYTYASTGEGVAVYVIDTGVRLNNTEFEGRAIQGANFVPNNTSDDDEYGHGTHVAGIIGSKKYGVVKKVQIISVKVIGEDGQGPYAQFIAGLDWAVADKRGKNGNVINISLGGEKSQFLNDAIEAAYKKGGLIVVSAGNSNSDSCLNSPASSPNAITVGSTDIYDKRSESSCFGKCVDIFAPGNNILSTFDAKTAVFSGTSMAAPHVAGLAAYYFSQYPNLSNEQMLDKILSSATKNVITDPGQDSPNLLVYNSIL